MGTDLTKKSLIRSRGQRRRSQPMAEINVTPFVDVMLVLLIVFMVAAPMLTVGVPVELPKTVARALPTEKEEPLTVTNKSCCSVQERVGDSPVVPQSTIPSEPFSQR